MLFRSELEPVIDRLVVTANSSERALPVDDLYREAVKVFGVERVFREENLKSAISIAMEQCTLINQQSEGVSGVVVTGSVVTAGETRNIVRDIVSKRSASE